MAGAGKRAQAAPPDAPEEPEVAAKRGRRSAADMEATYTQRSVLACEKEGWSKDGFLEHERHWAASSVPNKHLSIRHLHLQHKGGYKLLLWCNTCNECKEKQGWKGYSTYDVQSQQITRQYTPEFSHGNFSAVKAWNPLTSTTEKALKDFVAQNAHFSTQDLKKIAHKHQPDNCPTDSFLQTWGRNRRVHKGTRNNKTSAYKWVEADWQRLTRNLGSAESLSEATNNLKIAGAMYDCNATVVVFCNPQLLKDTLTSLTIKSYIKLCGDGTFRLIEGEWFFLTVGVLSKHCSRSDGAYAFRTTFYPLSFALANKESRPTYQFLFESLCSCSHRFAGVDLASACRQYHADMHLGEDLAQKSIFTNACRVADWAHVIGASKRPKTLGFPSAPDEKKQSYRAGVFATVQKNLTASGQKLLPLVKRALFCLRSVPTAMVFNALVQVLLETLLAQRPREQKAASALQRHYLATLAPDEAHAQFDVASWPANPDRFLVADWWGGLQRLQPGSTSGTHAQESWHRHKCKNYLQLRSDLASFASALEDFTKSRLQDLHGQGSCLPDVPLEPFPDKTVQDQDTVFFCMPRTLATFDHATKTWKETPDPQVQCPPAGFAKAFALLTRANTTDAMHQALLSLGLGPNPLLELEKVLKLFDTYVLVAVGPLAAKFWRREPLVGEANLHVQGYCAFCNLFCLRATCEHLRAAWIALGHASLQVPAFAERNRPVPLFEQEPVQVLLPHSSSSLHSSGSRPAPLSLLTHNSSEMSGFLRAHGWELWTSQKQQISVPQLASQSYPDVRAALPSVPAGVLYQMQRAAIKWLEPKALASAFQKQTVLEQSGVTSILAPTP